MTSSNQLRIASLIALALVGAVWPLGCAEAKADRLDVTYYYLPG